MYSVMILFVWYLVNFFFVIFDFEEDGELSVFGEFRYLEKYLGKRLKELEVLFSEGFGGVVLGIFLLSVLFRCFNMMEVRCFNCDNNWYIEVFWFGSV